MAPSAPCGAPSGRSKSILMCPRPQVRHCHQFIYTLEFTRVGFRNKMNIAFPGTSKAGDIRDGRARLVTFFPTPSLNFNRRTHPLDACIAEQLNSDDCVQAESLWRTRCAHCVSGELGWSGWMPMAMLPRKRAPDASLRYAADLRCGCYWVSGWLDPFLERHRGLPRRGLCSCMQRSGIVFRLRMSNIRWSHLTLCALTVQEPEAWEILADLEQIADGYKTRYRGTHSCTPA